MGGQGARGELFLAAILAAGGFDTATLGDLQVVQSEAGRIVCRMPVTQQVQNRYGTLHGGCIATLVDVVGSAALVTQSDRGGVSLSINTTYLNPAPGGQDVDIDARVVKLGKDIGVIEVHLRHATTHKLVAHGTHVKKLVSASDLSALFSLLSEVQDMDSQQEQQQHHHGQRQPRLQQLLQLLRRHLPQQQQQHHTQRSTQQAVPWHGDATQQPSSKL